MNRLETEFGDDGAEELHSNHLLAFSALYRFHGRTWGITVWAQDWQDAEQYCAAHGLKLDGQIIGHQPA